MKIITTESGLEFRMGARKPVAKGPRFKMRNYMMQSLPAPPEHINYSGPARSALSQMYDNDTLGCCVEAGIGHVFGILTANAGDEVIFTSAQIIAAYTQMGGYVPGNPSTDQGTDPETALNLTQNKGFAGTAHKFAAWLQVNAADSVELRQSIYLFEHAMFAIDLPDAWVNPAPDASGFTWDIAGPADPENGHFIVGCSYDATGVLIDTWGMLGLLTNAAIAAYPVPSADGACYVALSMDAINKAKQKAPNGFDFSQLLADIDSMGAAQ